MSKFGIKVSKEGKGVLRAGYNELEMTSEFDTMKIQGTGTLSVTFPEEKWYWTGTEPDPLGDNDYLTNTWCDLQEDSYTHGLGYVPLFSPGVFDSNVWWFYTDSPSSPYSINDVSDFLVPQRGPWGIGGFGEVVYAVVADTDKIYLRVRRIGFNAVFIPTITMPAETYNVNYVLYRNEANAEFNLLA